MRHLPLRRPHAILFTVLLAFAAVAQAGDVHTVQIVGSDFQPADLTISAGDMVTWVNDGGSNNLVADDGSFDNGPPSTDTWNFNHIFYRQGTWTYHSDGVAGTGQIVVEGLFGDGFEAGTTDYWSDVIPSLINCTCYFSSDCNAGEFCDWGPGGFSTVDICEWRVTKPEGIPGNGCDGPYIGAWIPNICDGICAPSSAGSALGHEDEALIAEAVSIWARAMIEPAVAGGGPIDPVLAARAEALPFRLPGTATLVGRQTADLLVQAGHAGFYKHFCHHEAYPDTPDPALFVDLSDACAAAGARAIADAAVAEMKAAGSGRAILEGDIRCPEAFGALKVRCAANEPTVDCLDRRVREFVTFVTTPRPDPRLLFDGPAWLVKPTR